jgi:toxin ParE1/3/4
MPRARRDLTGIYHWIGARSSNTAGAWYLGLKDAIRSLGAAPNRCPVTPEYESVRHLLYGQKPHVYRVIYRTLEGQRQVEVLHIRHGAMHEFAPEDLAGHE